MNLIFANTGRAAIGLILAIVFILTACGQPPAQNPDPPPQKPDREEPAPEEPEPLPAPAPPGGNRGVPTLAQGYADPAAFAPAGELTFLPVVHSLDGTAATGEGFYHFESRDQGSDALPDLLYYIDFAAGQDLPLCAAPNCAHDSEACTAWFPTCLNPKRLVPVGGKLVVLYCGADGDVYDLGRDGLPGIDVMNATGSERQPVFRFAASDALFFEFEEGAARDAEHLYFVVQHRAAESVTRTLCAFNVNTGSTFELYDLPGGNGRIVGVDGSALILEYLPETWSIFDDDISDYQVSRYDLATRQETLLFTRPFEKAAGGSVCEDGVRYLLNGDGALRAYDLQTGELTREARVDFVEGFEPQYSGFCGYWGGRLLLYSHKSNGDHLLPTLYYCAVDPRTGEAARIQQEYLHAASECVFPRLIAAETEQHYLILTGTRSVKQKVFGSDAVLNRDVNCYALIGKEDFWQGRQNWTAILGGAAEP